MQWQKKIIKELAKFCEKLKSISIFKWYNFRKTELCTLFFPCSYLEKVLPVQDYNWNIDNLYINKYPYLPTLLLIAFLADLNGQWVKKLLSTCSEKKLLSKTIDKTSKYLVLAKHLANISSTMKKVSTCWLI